MPRFCVLCDEQIFPEEKVTDKGDTHRSCLEKRSVEMRLVKRGKEILNRISLAVAENCKDLKIDISLCRQMISSAKGMYELKRLTKEFIGKLEKMKTIYSRRIKDIMVAIRGHLNLLTKEIFREDIVPVSLKMHIL